ncbi:lytic murein transglycosylase [Erwinia sorbitola]|uniref:Lytic murein transglycosylase n=1 Tax=Erwinia sorbitola TaxID=2681984 RepID=A0ABW9R6I4_9GAMM|nr:lytic murein transglycosylase [Erwinia sorbitola]MTD25705.1 lytic murein transglycosylase [Erwinia sorbitola]
MKLSAVNSLLFSLLVLGSSASHASFLNPPATTAAPDSTLSQQGRDPAQFPGYIEQLKAQARQQGFDDATIETAFTGVHFVDRVIKADRGQLENKVTLSDYLNRVLTPEKIAQGRDYLQQYQNQLQPIANASGVQAHYIVALWALESHFGNIQGREEVVSALATLAFEGRREAFFTKELMAALRIIQNQQMTAAELKGSWAGAMGQSQFMPSSFLNYGKDGDGDGKIDIWNNLDDVFASTANYLQREGWRAGQGWGVEVTLPAGFDAQQAGLKTSQAKSPAQWLQAGVQVMHPENNSNSGQRAWIVTPQDGDGRSFMVYDNFRTLMRWNRSYYFAISIGMMADAITAQPAVQ